MILYEYEAKKLLKDGGINIPRGSLVERPYNKLPTDHFPLVLKAQTLSGKRMDAGGIIFANNSSEAETAISKFFNISVNGEKVGKILAEEKIEPDGLEHFVSVSYDSSKRRPVLVYSKDGGTGVEERVASIFPIDPIEPIANVPKVGELSTDLIKKIVELFFANDCLLLEINPLVKTQHGYIALDAKINLDDTAFSRHKEWDFPPRSATGRSPTKREVAAKKIDEGDHRGTAGSAYFELPGDIAVLASGGGGSLTALDALYAAGGQPANYTEYSGNPPKEKIEKLAKIVLSKPGINGLWIVGAIANFTDIYSTLSGLVDGLRKVEKESDKKFNFPIVIRRGGPRDKEAFEMLRGIKDLDLHLYGEEISITESAKIIAKLAAEYAEKHELAS